MKISQLLKKRPFQPNELLRKYVDLALELGPSGHLSPQGRNFSFIVLYNIDLCLLILACLVIIVYFIYVTSQKLLRLVLNLTITTKRKLE